HVAQLQRVNEGKEHHGRHASREERRPQDRPEPLRQRSGRVVKRLLIVHREPAASFCPSCDREYTYAATSRARVSPRIGPCAGMLPFRPFTMPSRIVSKSLPYS